MLGLGRPVSSREMGWEARRVCGVSSVSKVQQEDWDMQREEALVLNRKFRRVGIANEMNNQSLQTSTGRLGLKQNYIEVWL